ncbi:MAG: GYD family protein [Nitrospirae bacterium GWD2_57_9]|nr:MAG: GYD family protein [Nitrospirae bacterium GWD2_57_9]OGW50586.1 MAG: GYD family protein [Nitrospirae bacterium GWC2_57_9]
MPAYLILFKYTQKGTAAIKESPRRVEQAMEIAKKLGGSVKTFYLLMGQFDTVFLLEAPDDETATKISLAISALGNVSTQTLRGFALDEFEKMISEMP